MGNGLLLPHRRRAVSPILTDSMAGVEGEADSPQTGAWSLRELDAGPGYVSGLLRRAKAGGLCAAGLRFPLSTDPEG
jgi:hypothetical protein